jgi:mannose-1-phosphate guanylyltransferase
MPKDQIEVVTRLNHKDGQSLVIENNFEWIDFGTWEAVSKFYDEQNMSPGVGGAMQIEGKDNFLWSNSGKTIATIGLSDIVVIESEEGILVSRKELSGQTTKIVEKINSGDL